MTYDIVIVGAGPGGYPAAIRATQLGKKVLLVDKGTIGGECLNWGCIPSKALISAADFYYKLREKSYQMGITADNVTVDLEKMMIWKEGIQNQLINGIKQLLKANNVDILIGSAKFQDPYTIAVTSNDSETIIGFENAIIATGAKFISLPGFEIDEKDILSAKGLLSINSIPEELICIGGGIIGLELGTVFAKLGSKVKIIELLPQLMTGVEKRLVQVVRKNLKKIGVEIYLNAKASSIKRDGKLTLEVDQKGERLEITGDKILLSIGKKAMVSNLGLDLNLDEKGFINVNDKFQTNFENIYAVGDCTGLPFLAHKATRQGIMAAESIVGVQDTEMMSIPGAIFTDPEIAFVGLSEAEAKEKGYDVVVGRSSFAGSGRALSKLSGEGLVRVIADKVSGLVLGVEIVGPSASDLISEAVLGLDLGASVKDIGNRIHPHPTLPEMFMEAADAIEGKAIHVPNVRK